jgi:ATP-dependent protease ClpP protease subunit
MGRSPANDRAISGIKAKLINRIGAVDRNLANELSGIKLPWFAIRNSAEDGSSAAEGVSPASAEIFIYDEIGGSFGVDATELVMAINEIASDQINVRINSPGGSVFDSIAIYNALVKHPANVTTYVDALAASAASIVAMAGDEVVMMRGSQMMIHDAMGAEFGNAKDMRGMADFLDGQSDNIATIYGARAGSDTNWRDAMLAETWLFADEAVVIGLADRVYMPPTKQVGDPTTDPEAADPETEPEKPGEVEPEKPGETEPDDEDVEEEDPEDLMQRRHLITNRGYKYNGRSRAPIPAPLAREDFSAFYGSKTLERTGR